MTTVLVAKDVATPVGDLRLAVRDGKVCALVFADGWDRSVDKLEARLGPVDLQRDDDPVGARSALAAWVDGDLTALEEMELDLGGTPFQQKVWATLCKIPAGTVISYGQLAENAGFPRAARAVGSANGANPACIVVPCHRVIHSGGTIGGYGGGLHRKRWLLAHEGIQLP
ncbi:MAG TPA: methylated-DNA--[protein]-cysteine S-methyltransferase [Acidimicrobiales bacterium]|nr:methylated-DNA--[protein]-cysteine S-methyltransferase [Acidimicrobiales bacterium]